jgi:mono/diheme cytochrome c family protein
MQLHQRAVILPVFVLVVISCPRSFGSPAQLPASGTALSNSQKEGRRVFQQKCAVCHISTSSTARQYGPMLYRGLVEGNEDSIGETIMNGRGDKMPGFRYTLQPTQINDTIEYLKTLDKPSRTVASERPEK